MTAPAERTRAVIGLPERWYVVDATGAATLCRDYDDAQDVAAECFVAWPQRGPHRVVMLGDLAAERERWELRCRNVYAHLHAECYEAAEGLLLTMCGSNDAGNSSPTARGDA